eukprot:765032-Hanusia_phi.AAC.4
MSFIFLPSFIPPPLPFSLLFLAPPPSSLLVLILPMRALSSFLLLAPFVLQLLVFLLFAHFQSLSRCLVSLPHSPTCSYTVDLMHNVGSLYENGTDFNPADEWAAKYQVREGLGDEGDDQRRREKTCITSFRSDKTPPPLRVCSPLSRYTRYGGRVGEARMSLGD